MSEKEVKKRKEKLPSKNRPTFDDVLIPITTVAGILGVTAPAIYQNRMVKRVDGKVPASELVRLAVERYERTRGKEDDLSSASKVKDLRQRVALESEQIDLERKKKNLIPREDILFAFTEAMLMFRTRLKAVGGTVAPELITLHPDIGLMASAIERKIWDAMEETKEENDRRWEQGED